MKKILLIPILVIGIALPILALSESCKKSEPVTQATTPGVKVSVETTENKTGAQKSVDFPTVIRINSTVYEKHQKKIAIFDHLKHADYDCGKCHHNAEGAPLSREVIQAQGINKCSKCHKKVGKRPAGLTKKELLGWHKETLHKNCRECHRKIKKEGKMAPPVTCNDCHTE